MSLFFLAKRFVAGEELEPAIKVVGRINDSGMSATLNLLGEHVSSREDVLRSTEEYIELFDRIADAGVNANVSLKLTQVGLDIDEELCFEQVSKFLERAEASNNFLRLDMEGTRYTQQTLDMFYRLYREYKKVGVVIQAYLYRSASDIHKLNRAQARVRLCKGAYKEPPELAIQRMLEIRANYMRLVERLIEEGSYTGIATHDDQLIEGVKALVENDRRKREKFEFQMLYGIRPGTQVELVRQGYRMRVYVPYGSQWLPYFYRRLRERKENVWFVIKNLFKA